MRQSESKLVRFEVSVLFVGALMLAVSPEILAEGGEVVVVSTLYDISDFSGAKTVSDLPGPDGKISFREAVTASNNTAGGQVIEFAIPTSEFWLDTSMALLELEQGAFSLTGDGEFLDFASQTRNIGDTNPDGNEVGIYGLEPNGWGVAAIFVNGDSCIIQGLGTVYQRGYAVEIVGNANRVIGCTISGPLHAGVIIEGDFYGTGEPAVGNIIGGTLPEEGNELSGGSAGVRINAPAEDNLIIGNVITGGANGVEVWGSIYSTTPFNNRIGGPTPEERNVISGAGTFDGEGCPYGAMVDLYYANGTIVEGNYLGTNIEGTLADAQYATVGVGAYNSDDTIIRGNLVSGIMVDGWDHCAGDRFGIGISVTGDSDNTIVTGNLVGTDCTGTYAIANYQGVVIAPGLASEIPNGTTFGGPLDGEGNTVAFNELDGVRVYGSVSGAPISGNSIHGNGLLGIDLLRTNGAAGVTPNDSGDADNGGNKLQNFPVLTLAEGDDTQITVTGTLNSVSDGAFTLEFFANSDCDSSGYGEGQLFLGSVEVQTDGSGNASFEQSLSASLTDGAAITATATDAAGNTSEFSACLAAVIIPTQACDGDANGDEVVDPLDSGYIQARFGCAVGTGDATCDSADVNGDALVDPLDVGYVLARFGSCP